MNRFQIKGLSPTCIGTCKVQNKIETKRNETYRNETKPNETKPNETKRNKNRNQTSNLHIS
jgi:hypothetical protein